MIKGLHLPDKFVDKVYKFEGVVEIFPQKGGWYFVRVPQKYTKMTEELADRGLVAVTVVLGSTTWKTSLLPYGDGTQFIALSAKVRKAEGVVFGGVVELAFRLRER